MQSAATRRTEPDLPNVEYYKKNLFGSKIQPKALAQLCQEKTNAAYNILTTFHKLSVLIELMQHSEIGVLLVKNYLISHAEYLKNYDCSKLESYVIAGKMLGLVRLFGAVIENKEACGVLLTNHGAQQQLENIVSAYRYKSKNHFDIFISDENFYLYFQSGVLDLNVINNLYDKQTRLGLKVEDFKDSPWCIRDYYIGTVLITLLHTIPKNSASYNWLASYSCQALRYYDMLKSRLDDSSYLAWNILHSFVLKSPYISIDLGFAEQQTSDTFKLDLLLELIEIDAILPEEHLNYCLENIFAHVYTLLTNADFVTYYIEFANKKNSVNAQRIASFLYSFLLNPQYSDETEDDYNNRIAATILLVEKFDLPDRTWWKYAKMMGCKGDKPFFDTYIVEHPDHYCRAMLAVYRQKQIYFPDEILTSSFQQAFTTAYAHALQLNLPFMKSENEDIFKIVQASVAYLIKHRAREAQMLKLLLSRHPTLILAGIIADRDFCPKRNFKSLIFFAELLRSGQVIISRNDASELLDKTIDNIYHKGQLTSCKYLWNWMDTLINLGADELTLLITAITNSKSDLFDRILMDAVARRTKCNILELYQKIPDPLSYAVKQDASPTRIQLMIDAGFDVTRFKLSACNLNTQERLASADVIILHMQKLLVSTAQVPAISRVSLFKPPVELPKRGSQPSLIDGPQPPK